MTAAVALLPGLPRGRPERPAVVLDPAALRLVGADALLAMQIVPYAVTDTELFVAAATPRPDELAQRLRQQTRLAVSVTWAPPDEIEAALVAALSPERTAAVQEAQAGAWLDALGVARVRPDHGFDRDAELSASRLERLESLSLATGRPAIDVAHWRLNRALAPLIPEEVALTQPVVPLIVLGRVLLVVTAAASEHESRLPWQTLAARLATETGLVIQVVLADLGAVRRLADELYGTAGGAETDPTAASPGPRIDWRTGADGPRPRGPSRIAQAARLALEATGITEDAEAVAGRVTSVDLDGRTPDPALVAVLPHALARRFTCLPLDRERDTVRVVAPAEPPALLAPLLAEVIGRPVRLVAAPTAAIAAAIRRAYRGRPEPATSANLPPLGAYLVRSGQVTQDQLDHALAEQGKTGELLGRILVQTGAISDDRLLEALAVRLDLPRVRLAQTLPDPAVVRLIPEETARADRALAVRQQDGCLHVAIADPANGDVIARLERVTGLHVHPLVAAEDDLLAAIARLYRAGECAVSTAVDRFFDWLLARGVLDRGTYVDVRAHYLAGGGIDEALIGAGVVTPDAAAAVIAEGSGLPRMDLWPREERIEVIDALGSPGVQRRLIDPIDPVAARRLDYQTADRAAAVPVGLHGDALIVAVADPFDSDAAALIRSAVAGPVELRVATRDSIRAAIRRTLGRRQVGDYLLEAGLVSRDELDRALALARATNVRIGKALLTLGYVTQEQLATQLSEQFNIPFFDLTEMQLDPAAARLIPEELARRGGVLPLAADDRTALLAVVDPTDVQTIEEAIDALDREVTPVLVTERQFDAALQSVYREEYVNRASLELLSRAPQDSAAKVWTTGQLVTIYTTIGTILLGLVVAPIPTLIALTGFCTVFYFLLSGYKLFLIYRSLAGMLEETVTPEEVAALDDRDLPIYTVLVPVYKEAEVLPILVDALGKMDYPRTKLDVIILLEEDDQETQAAARAMRLPEGFRALVVPYMKPKTKPKACNYGLLQAEGEFLVIYDAEDVPEPDQLKKAVVVFRRYDERLACIQSKLNYFNRDQNLLTRWFTLEYSTWFDLLLPGLDNTGAPIPLGGTSNHFRADLLRELGGWDPFNTTEDADLGLRIFKRGYRTVVMNSTTYEEANSNLYNWIRQRSRWVKGYMQTWLVHMRNPLKLYRELGFKAFFSFQMIVGGTFFALLLNPVFWVLTALWFIFKWDLIRQIYPGPIFYLGAIGLYVGNFAFVYINVSGALRREYYHLVKYALLTPLYWGLMSVAAWQAFRELIFKPHYWQKTQHGLFTGKAKVPTTRRPLA